MNDERTDDDWQDTAYVAHMEKALGAIQYLIDQLAHTPRKFGTAAPIEMWRQGAILAYNAVAALIGASESEHGPR
jgi:hypothetical protein